MNYDRGFGFLGGFLLGGIVGAAIALLLAPESGEQLRGQIRDEGVMLRDRSQEFGNDRVHDAQRIVKQGQQGVADMQAQVGGAIQGQKDNLQGALGK
jgi:gas vesicle protein